MQVLRPLLPRTKEHVAEIETEVVDYPLVTMETLKSSHAEMMMNGLINVTLDKLYSMEESSPYELSFAPSQGKQWCVCVMITSNRCNH